MLDLRAALNSAEYGSSSKSGSTGFAGAPEYAEYSTELSTVGVSIEWFAGSMSKRDCEAAVGGGIHGSFLVREGSKGERFVLCVNDRGLCLDIYLLYFIAVGSTFEIYAHGNTWRSVHNSRVSRCCFLVSFTHRHIDVS